MKLILKTVLFAATLLLSTQAHSQGFIEGTHYSIVDGAKQLSKQQETVEYFSFSCPGCYAMEPYVKGLQAELASINLRRVHLPFGGRKAKLSQKAFVLMELLNATQHHDAIFNRIHLQKNLFDTEQELIEFFQSLGYDEIELTTALNSFTADSMLRTMNNEARKNNIKSVPTIIVNGKYQVNSRAIYSGARLSALIEYLDGLP